jgi:hypothetical protein
MSWASLAVTHEAAAACSDRDPFYPSLWSRGSCWTHLRTAPSMAVWCILFEVSYISFSYIRCDKDHKILRLHCLTLRRAAHTWSLGETTLSISCGRMHFHEKRHKQWFCCCQSGASCERTTVYKQLCLLGSIICDVVHSDLLVGLLG